MNANVKNNGTKKVALKVVSKAEQKTLSIPTKKVVSEKDILKAVTKKANQYRTDVLEVNSNFKTALRTTNKAIKLLIASETLSNRQVAICKAILKDDVSYKKFDAKVRRTPSNMVTPFYVLQALYKVAKK